jgi:hypothetical protein
MLQCVLVALPTTVMQNMYMTITRHAKEIGEMSRCYHDMTKLTRLGWSLVGF